MSPTVPPATYGDADGSGMVSNLDVSHLLRAAGGLGRPADLGAGDVVPSPSCDPDGVGDGALDIRDALRVLRRLHALEPLWP